MLKVLITLIPALKTILLDGRLALATGIGNRLGAPPDRLRHPEINDTIYTIQERRG